MLAEGKTVGAGPGSSRSLRKGGEEGKDARGLGTSSWGQREIGRSLQVTLAAVPPAAWSSSDLLLFGLVRKVRVLVGRRRFGRSRGTCSGLPRPQVTLGSRLNKFSYPQASPRIKTEAIAAPPAAGPSCQGEGSSLKGLGDGWTLTVLASSAPHHLRFLQGTGGNPSLGTEQVIQNRRSSTAFWRGCLFTKASLPWSASPEKFPQEMGGGAAASDQMWRSQTESIPTWTVPFWATVPGLAGEGGPSLQECFILAAAA